MTVGLRFALIVSLGATGASGGASAPPVLEPPPDVRDRVTRTFHLSPEAPIRVEAMVGTVSIAAWDRDEVAIDLEREAPTWPQLEQLLADVGERDGALTARLVQRDEGREPALRGSISVRAPATTPFGSIRLFEGRLGLSGLRGSVTAEVRRGPIEAVDVSGAIRLETVIGDIVVKRAQLTAGGVIRLRTFNGDVRLDLLEVPADARILALTLNGRISSTIPLTMRDRAGPRFAEATLGRGEPLISIDAVNGDIAITAGESPNAGPGVGKR